MLEERGNVVVRNIGVPKNFLHVELKVTAQARAQFAVAREAKFVAILTEVQVRHRSNEADELAVHAGHFIITRWAIGLVLGTWGE